MSNVSELLQRDCATLRVIKYLAESLKVIRNGTVSYSFFIAISKIFSVKEWCDLEIRIRCHSKLLKEASFNRPYTTYHWSAIVSTALSSIIFEKKRDIGWKSWFIHTTLHSTPPMGAVEYCHTVCLVWKKTRMVWLPDGKKSGGFCSTFVANPLYSVDRDISLMLILTEGLSESY